MSVPRIPRTTGRVAIPVPTGRTRVSPPAARVPVPAPAPRPTGDAVRRKGEALIVDIRKRKARIAEDFYEIGKALDQLADPRVFGPLGYKTFEDLLTNRKLMSRMQAFKLMLVARTYPKALALKLGVEKAYGLHRYVMATPAEDLAVELARRDARIAGRPISALSLKDLHDATKRAATGIDATRPIPADLRRRAAALQRALRARGARTATVRAQRVGAGVVLQIRIEPGESDVLLP